jgi:PTS system nitrogen regulatory IIA component
MEIGDSFRQRIEDQIGVAVTKYFDGGYSGQVIVQKANARFSADCKVHLDSGVILHAAGEAMDPQLAFDAASERIEKRLRRYKRKLKDHHAGNHPNGFAEVAYTVMDGMPDHDDEVADDFAPAIVAESTKQMKTMSVATAVQGTVEHRLPSARRQHWLDRRSQHQKLRTRRGAAETCRSPSLAQKEKEMALADLLQQNAIIPALRVNSKKQLLQELSAKASKVTGLSEREVFDVILQRERLGSTGVGNGIAIPHGKLASVNSIVGIFARLDQPVDFEALDDQPVDLVFLLLAPEGAGADHLKALSRIARVLRDQDLVSKLRATDSASAIYAFLNEEQASNAA